MLSSFLLDRLLQYEKLDESSGDSDLTASTDSDNDSHKVDGVGMKRKKGTLPVGFDPSAVLGGMGFTSMPQGPPKKKSRPSAKKKTGKQKANPMSREELERHLEAKQSVFGIEKAPALLPMEIFSNDNSNMDSDAMLDIKDEEDDDLVIDMQQ